jgi:PAS domain S-box-containing protein
MFASLKRFDVRVSIGYFIAATVWIFLSDSALNVLLSRNPSLFLTLGSLKDWIFVALTAAALFIVLRNKAQKRDRVEKALQHSENRFAATFHGSPVATSISRSEAAYLVEVNDAFVELFGYQRKELIGRTPFDVGLWVHPEERRKVLMATAAYGRVHNLEMQGRTKSGARIDLLVSSQVINLGDELHIANIFYDVTKQRKLEEQICDQALLLENVSDAVVSADVDFNIRSWNPAAELIFGWRAEEVIGKSASELFQTEYLNSTREDVRSQLQATGVWSGQTTHRCKDESRIHLSTSMSYVYSKEGRHIGIVAVNRDITEVIRAQQEKQEAAELRLELEKQTELVRLKEDFISIVSHEFRTPLTVIMASSELLQTYYGRMPAERQQKHFQTILEQTKYMAVLIDDVLTINRARAGKLDFNPAPVNLVIFCQDTLQYLEDVDRGKHNVFVTCEGDLSSVRMDAKLLQHIVVNLLSNAIKYSPNGGEVRLDVERQGDEIVFQISDQGIGIPAESLPHLYEPFYRAKNTGDIGGTGLGTAIVKESVDLHKGTISYNSEVGIGTTVTVCLPVNTDDDVS